jgi:adenosine deaminase
VDISSVPKSELHVHIEGTLEPELMLALARRNGVPIPHTGVEQVRAAYAFTNLQSFLDVYYQGAAVLRTVEDFRDLMAAYLRRAAADGVRRAEIFFDPQTHTERGVGFPIFMKGFGLAMEEAEREVSTALIMCFLRHLPQSSALETLAASEPFLDQIIAVGLDSSEVGFPPERFAETFRRARDLGLRAVAHAGEEGPSSYIWGALDILGAERIDHGVRALEDPALVERLRDQQVPLTVCPLSNVKLRVFDRLEDHPLKRMLDLGLRVSINSDDPAYFDGYIGENYRRVQVALHLTDSEVQTLAANSIESSFISEVEKAELRQTSRVTPHG